MDYFLLIVYLLIGVIIVYYKGKEYDSYPKDNIEKEMLNILFAFILFFWPIYILYLKLKKKYNEYNER